MRHNLEACFIQLEGGESCCVWMNGWMEHLKLTKNLGKKMDGCVCLTE